MIRILVADDHAAVIRGLRQLMARERDIRIVAEAGNGHDVLDKLEGGGIDLVLLDMHMPGPCGVDLIARIRTHDPHRPILVLSMCNEALVARAACRAGATGYLAKDNEPEVLMQAIRTTAAGRPFIDPALVDAADPHPHGVRTAARDSG
jgi:DNA-binding NarL/FixJ family response regulator